MPVSSPWPNIKIPDVDLWASIFERGDLPYPESKGMEIRDSKEGPKNTDKVVELYLDVATGRTFTYRNLKDASISFGCGLKSRLGFRKGDVMAIFTPNCVEFSIGLLGCMWAGGVVAPANSAYNAQELAVLLEGCGATVLVAHNAVLGTALKAVGASKGKLKVIVVGSERQTDAEFRFEDLLVDAKSQSSEVSARPRFDNDNDLALLCSSSGTTGMPKIACLSHRNMVANMLQFAHSDADQFDWKTDKLLAFLPLYHVYGLMAHVLSGVYRGIWAAIVPKFDPHEFLSLIQKHRITFVYLVPPVAMFLAKHDLIDKYDISSINKLQSAAAPLTRELQQALWKRLRIPMGQIYGITEMSPAVSNQTWNKPLGSVGKLIPNTECKIVDVETGLEVETGVEGEIWLRGPNVFKGYLNNEAGTHAAMATGGWLRTGDIGYFDKNDNMFISDRLKELIKFKGSQVAPAELEGILLGNENVDDVCVIGIYSEEDATELPKAYIVPRKGSDMKESGKRAIAEWLAARVAAHKRLRGGVEWIDAVPRSAAGKILRRILRDRAKQDTLNARSKL